MAARCKLFQGFLIHGAGLFAGLFLLSITVAQAQTNLQYQQPPKAMVDIVDALPTPGVELSPAGGAAGKRWMLIEHFSGLPTVPSPFWTGNRRWIDHPARLR